LSYEEWTFTKGVLGNKGSYRLFFRKYGSYGQHKVVFIQKCLGQTSSPPEGIRTNWATPLLVIGVESESMFLCESCGHFSDRIELKEELEEKIKMAKIKINEIKKWIL